MYYMRELYRKIDSAIKDFYKTPKKALMLTGARQTGKTYAVRRFGKDFKAYAQAQRKVEAAYRDEAGWAKSAILNVACSGKFTSDRTIQQYVDEIWHLDKVNVVSDNGTLK